MQKTNQYLHELTQVNQIHNINELNALFNSFKTFKPSEAKAYIDASTIEKTFKLFNQEDIKEVIYSYLTDEGKIEPSIYLNMFARQFSLLSSALTHLDYFYQYPINSLKQAQLLCVKTTSLYKSKSLDSEALDNLYRKLQLENPELFDASFFKTMINSDYFLNQVDSKEFQEKFLNLHATTMPSFIKNNPEWIGKHKKIKMLKFLLLAGYDECLIENKELAQKMIINFLTSSHLTQAQVILDIVQLDTKHLKKLLKIIERKEYVNNYSDDYIYHPNQINKIRMMYEKALLNETINVSNEINNKKMKL